MPAPPPSTQPDRAVLAGTVERVTFRNAESGFCVLRTKARAHRDLVTIVGHAATIAAGRIAHQIFFQPDKGEYGKSPMAECSRLTGICRYNIKMFICGS